LKKVEMHLLLIRIHVLSHNVPAIMDTMKRACDAAGIGYTDADAAKRRSRLPSDVDSFAAATAAAESQTGDPEDDAIGTTIICLVSHAGPTIYTALPDHGGPFFDIAFSMGLKSSALVRVPALAYVMLAIAFRCIEGDAIDLAIAINNYAKSIEATGTIWQGFIDIAMSTQAFVNSSSIKDISYKSAWDRSLKDDNTHIASYVLALVSGCVKSAPVQALNGNLIQYSPLPQNVFNDLVAGRDAASIVSRAERDLKLLSGASPTLLSATAAVQRTCSLFASPVSKQDPLPTGECAVSWMGLEEWLSLPFACRVRLLRKRMANFGSGAFLRGNRVDVPPVVRAALWSRRHNIFEASRTAELWRSRNTALL
jgi:hypothetical protein